MASEEMGLFSAQRLDNRLNPHPQLVFPESFSCGPPPPPPRLDSAAAPVAASAAAAAVGDPGPKTTRELTGFLDHHHYFRPQPQATEFRGSMFADRRDCHNWNTSSRASTTPSGDGSEDDDDDDDDDNEGEDEAEGRAVVDNHNNISNNNSKVNNNSDKVGNQKPKDIPNFGSTEGNLRQCGSRNSVEEARNTVTVADANGAMYYSQYLQGTGVSSGQKDIVVVDNGCGFSGRKESSYSSESGESLRAILSDPITGALMDDGVILPCGHSFGNGGVEHVIRTKACFSCAQPVSEDSVAPNLSLRAAVQAFRREEELQVNRPPKRRKERPEQEKGTSGDPMLGDLPKGRGVQFPFVVTDRVIIKGNKRTPLRFVGREAVVTTQCLNGWYVVKTLDNAESVKLQYRSLAKAPDRSPSQTISSSKTASWL